MLHSDKTCTSADNIYIFKVRDYTTELVGRKNIKGDFYYIQRGDGEMYKYDADRIVFSQKINNIQK